MNRFINRLQKSLVMLVLALGLASAIVGCCHHCGGHGRFGGIDNCSDVPKGAIPLPTGAYLRAYNARQENKAEVDDFVIYTNEWSLEDDLELGKWGSAHLTRMMLRLPTTPFAVMLQPADDDELNAKRRAKIVGALENVGIVDAASRVVVLTPEAEGLFGGEAERKVQRVIDQFSAGGAGGAAGGGGSVGGGGTFSGGFSGFGFR